MARKKHLSAALVVGDDVMSPSVDITKPTGSPVGQHLARAHQKAKDTIDELTRTLETERKEWSAKVANLHDEIARLKEGGGSPVDVELKIAEVKAANEKREKELQEELRSTQERMLRLEREMQEPASGRVVVLDPKRVRRSQFSNRLALSFRDEAFERLVRSLKSNNGNDLPIKVRPVEGDPDHDYEVVYGHRRHEGTLAAGTPLYATIHDVSDQEMVGLMHLENDREDLSPYEEAMAFRTWLDTGLYERPSELADAIGESRSFVSQRLAIADLPKSVFLALRDPRQLGLRAWRTLCEAYRKRPDAIREAAEILATYFEELEITPVADVQAIYSKLVKAGTGRSPNAEKTTRQYSLPSGTPLFRAQKGARGYSISFDPKGVAEDVQEEALAELEMFLVKRLGKS